MSLGERGREFDYDIAHLIYDMINTSVNFKRHLLKCIDGVK